MTLEQHLLEPFLPENARLLFLGSFPPPRQRWCMEFYYPNFQNDHWRIEGAAWFGDRNYFVDVAGKRFLKEKIVDFLNQKGIALYDTAQTVKRLKDNASDAYLEIVEQRIFGFCCSTFRSVAPLPPLARRPQERCVAISALKASLPWDIRLNSKRICFSTDCPPHQGLIHWLLRKK